MKRLRELYNENESVKQSEQYSSIHYNMSRFDEAHRELDKTHYIDDNVERLERIREIFKKGVTRSGLVTPREDKSEVLKHFENNIDYYEEIKENRLFYGVWVWDSIKRELELKCYLDIIIKKADEMAQKNVFDAVCYLIDQKYTYHKNILDEPKDDFVLREEINMVIFDYLQLKINDLTQKDTPESSSAEIRRPKKPFLWHSSKMSFGTLFGVLFNNDIITGNKTDFVDFITNAFEEIGAKSTLKDNMYLKQPAPNENKKYYCSETEDLLTDWILFLKTTPQNKKSSKQ